MDKELLHLIGELFISHHLACEDNGMEFLDDDDETKLENTLLTKLKELGEGEYAENIEKWLNEYHKYSRGDINVLRELYDNLGFSYIESLKE